MPSSPTAAALPPRAPPRWAAAPPRQPCVHPEHREPQAPGSDARRCPLPQPLSTRCHLRRAARVPARHWPLRWDTAPPENRHQCREHTLSRADAPTGVDFRVWPNPQHTEGLKLSHTCGLHHSCGRTGASTHCAGPGRGPRLHSSPGCCSRTRSPLHHSGTSGKSTSSPRTAFYLLAPDDRV